MPRTPRAHVLFAALAAAVAILAILRDPAEPPALAGATFGRGPTIVLVHGLAGSASDWLPVARRLAARHRVLLAELPGHGRTPMPGSFSLETAAAALSRAIDAAGGGPVFLVGHSVGGLVAAEVAVRRRDQVRGLVLVETALKPQVSDAEREAMLGALDHDYDAFLRAAYLSFGRDSAQGEALATAAAAVDAAVMKPWIRLALGADISAAAGDIRVPVLAILSDRSWPLGEPWPVTAAALGYPRIAILEPRRITDSGHYPMRDDPVEVASMLSRFAASFDHGPVARATR